MKNYYYEEIAMPKILHNQQICYEPHFHNEIEIIIMYEGKARVILNENRYTFSSGECLIVFPNVIHSYYTDEKVDVGKFIFKIDSECRLAEIMRTKLPLCPIIQNDEVAESGIITLSREIIDGYSTYPDFLKEAYLSLLTAKVLERIKLTDREKTVENNTVLSVLEYCEAHFKEDLTLKTLSAELHISQSHLSHIFCNRLKINFRQYLNFRRINEAKILLRQTDYSVTEISESIGFGSLRGFDKAFRLLTGVTPREYRSTK